MLNAITQAKWFKPAFGATLTALCGLVLWATPLGEAWENASYDHLFRFGARPVTNRVVFLLMDDLSHRQFQQSRDQPWDRALHTAALSRLTEDGAAMVVFDIHFKSSLDPATDAAFAAAMRRNGKVVLMANTEESEVPGAATISPPNEIFLGATTHWGVGKADAARTGGIARRHWPFYKPNEGNFHSLGWTAARAHGANWNFSAEQQWLRYYGEAGPWERVSYRLLTNKPPGFFRDKIVFIGNWPETSDPGIPERDKFCSPYTGWNHKAIGGVEIHATTFLNLVNGDWLRRPAPPIELLLLVCAGGGLGAALCRLSRLKAALTGFGIALAVTLAFVSWSYHTNYWFPWLIIAGAQVPCAVAFAWFASVPRVAFFLERFPGYETVGAPFGEGAYGRVWLVRNRIGQLQALKEIERAKFQDASPYEREFHGVKNFKPISNLHPGLLCIDHVNRNESAGYFYYVMELGDPLDPEWEQKGNAYKPWNLDLLCKQSPKQRLPARDCVRIGIALLQALEYLHQRGLVHRDIKPSNVIFVASCPKLADVGLVREAASAANDVSAVGTPPYMPPPPEQPGTPQADVYAMGKLLYVISTGRRADAYCELSESLVQSNDWPELFGLNTVFCRACHLDLSVRYATATEMLLALHALEGESGTAKLTVR